MRGPAAVVAIVACVVSSCSFTTNLDALDDGRCPSGSKACLSPTGKAECVSLGEAAFGCASAGCSPCFVENGVADCSPGTGQCAIQTCNPGYADCDVDYGNGCESHLDTDVDNCGKCGATCPSEVVNGAPGCATGRCTVGRCNAGWADCNGIGSDGCETPCAIGAKLTCIPTDGGTGFTCL